MASTCNAPPTPHFDRELQVAMSAYSGENDNSIIPGLYR